MHRFYDTYQKKVLPILKQEFGTENALALPRLDKVVLNVGAGKSLVDAKFLENAKTTLEKITGQKPVFTKARKSISNFKIRLGMNIGVKVTLRREKMYDFLDKFINVTLPRVHDFRGVPKTAVDKQGNLNIGFKEHIMFPEIKATDIDGIHGLEVTIVSKGANRAGSIRMLELLGFPFRKEEEKPRKK